MVVQMSTSPLRFRFEFFSVIECMTKDGRDVQEKERKHTTDREIADTNKDLLEKRLLRKKWTVTSGDRYQYCLLYTSPSPRDRTRSRMPSSA